ncbi:MAG: hypothetical protein WC651_01455 [Candidatus Gracilibacteria bacterium]|jgi:hypothetical protein
MPRNCEITTFAEKDHRFKIAETSEGTGRTVTALNEEKRTVTALNGKKRTVTALNGEVLCQCDGTLKAVAACLANAVTLRGMTPRSSDADALQKMSTACAHYGAKEIADNTDANFARNQARDLPQPQRQGEN